MLWSVRQLAAAVADEVCAVLKKAASAWLRPQWREGQVASLLYADAEIAMAAEDESAVFCETDDEVPRLA